MKSKLNKKIRGIRFITGISLLLAALFTAVNIASADPGYLAALYKLPADNQFVNQYFQTQEIEEGISLTLGEAFYDGDQIIFTLILEGDLPDNSINFSDPGHRELLVNGEMTGFGGSGYILRDENDPNALVSLQEILLDEDSIDSRSDKIHLSLNIKDIVIYSLIEPDNENSPFRSYTISGSWTFEFEIDGSALAKMTEIYEINQTFTVDGTDYTVEKLVISPVNQKIVMTSGEERNFIEYWTIRSDKGAELPLQLRSTSSNILDPTYRSTYLALVDFLSSERINNYYQVLNGADTLTITPWLGNMAYYPDKTYLDTTKLSEFQFSVKRKPGSE